MYSKSKLRQLTKAELERELDSLGLDSTGSRAELHDRL